MGAPTKQEARAVPTANAIVARGRTVFGLDGKRHTAGEEVELPVAEIARLRARGFLVDPQKPVVPLADGPTFGTATGPRIKRG
ncbi:hypothetical protein [Burkholderia multivorans]|uniref:hypothetical protein n=1 Tax=Burkholderia multivorans TaxID=87883 RepID=UPI000CFE96A6|nr:hypothetical protein [Burkholderia multivorans]PRG49408.1 hypothetical protein C6T62_01750 [Burkholderia multivorans]HEM7839804.1 hypothetical protein [Burkholderia multivorans]HEM7872885.1 hypothetical protein [Burkholderia multivorans]HEM7905394.1 hypothetical protein [Burkholderia multivorans]HEM8537585.1 hypothetical protein [Burkholderia multivorans]